MFKRIFLDANVIADLFDSQRPFHKASSEAYLGMVARADVQLFTSCDIITTVYYIEAKRDRFHALEKVADIVQTLKVIEFSNGEIIQTCQLMRTEPDFTDLEDAIQYVLALKANCDLILSNDAGFISKNIKLLTTTQFIKEAGIQP